MTRHHNAEEATQAIPPNARIHITHRPHSGTHQGEDIELPLKFLVVGNFKGYREDTPLAEREPVTITPSTFNEVMAAANIEATLSGNPSKKLHIRSLEDFHPDRTAEQLPDTRLYLQIRQTLVELKNRLLTEQQRTALIKSLQSSLEAIVDRRLDKKANK